MARKKSKTAYLLIRRNFDGEVFTRHHSYSKKSDAKLTAKQLRKMGFKARIFHSKGERYEYTVYKRRKN